MDPDLCHSFLGTYKQCIHLPQALTLGGTRILCLFDKHLQNPPIRVEEAPREVPDAELRATRTQANEHLPILRTSFISETCSKYSKHRLNKDTNLEPKRLQDANTPRQAFAPRAWRLLIPYLRSWLNTSDAECKSYITLEFSHMSLFPEEKPTTYFGKHAANRARCQSS